MIFKPSPVNMLGSVKPRKTTLGSTTRVGWSSSTWHPFAEPTSGGITFWGRILGLTDLQQVQISEFERLLLEWNRRLNLVSRNDRPYLWKKHILPCLAMGMPLKPLPDGAEIVDVGCGGGLPGLPLAISFPNVNFNLVDARKKKINAVRDMSNCLGLCNIQAIHSRVEDLSSAYDGKYDYVLGRAVAPMHKFIQMTQRLLNVSSMNATKSRISTFDESGDGHHPIWPMERGILYMRGIGAANTEKELRELGIEPHAVLSIADLLGKTMEESEFHTSATMSEQVFQDFQYKVQSGGYSHIFHFTANDIQRITLEARTK